MMTAQKTIAAIAHCVATHNPSTAERILAEYVQEAILAHETSKLDALREAIKREAAQPTYPPGASRYPEPSEVSGKSYIPDIVLVPRERP